jgi:acetoin utilization protein AcuB
MLVSQYMIRSLPELSGETSLSDVFREDYPEEVQYAPVLQEGKFLGFLDLENLEIEKESKSTVSQCELEMVSVQILENQHIFEVIPLFVKTGINLLPVWNEEGETEGYISQTSINEVIGETHAFQTEGGILVLTVPAIHYSLSEISRLVEANQAKILALVLETDPALNQNYLVHLKINQPDLSRIVATLERFEYHVLEVHQTMDASSLDKDRFDQLMRYLGI